MTISRIRQHPSSRDPLEVHRMPFRDISRVTWDRLHADTPGATPFSRWTFHSAWWDAYGDDAVEHYLVVSRPGADVDGPDAIVGILPLMIREAPPSSDRDDASGSREAPEPAHAEAGPAHTIFMAASYHADYAAILGAAEELPAVTAAAVADLARDPGPPAQTWSMIDLRRLRARDPALEDLQRAFEAVASRYRWSVSSEIEDVCPVVTLPRTRDELLAGLGAKARHELRRKLRRAQADGSLELRYRPLDRDSADRFIDIHEARWGDAGLFLASPDGDRSRRFFRCLVDLEAAEGEAARMHLAEVSIDGRVIYGIAGFADGQTCYFYNAGMDPAAAPLSPGVVGTMLYMEDRIAAGDRRFDFLRGNEAYKYAWGARDEAVYRLVVRRNAPREGAA